MDQIAGAIYYLCAAFFTRCLIKVDFSRRGSCVLSVVSFVLGFIAVTALCTVVGIEAVFSLIPLVILLPLYLSFQFISVFKGLKLIFVLLTSSVLMFLPPLLSICLSVVIDKEVLMTITALLGIAATITVLIRFVRPRLLFILEYVNSSKYWLSISFIPILYNSCVYMLGLYNRQSDHVTPLFFQVMLMGLTLFAYVLIGLTFTQIKKNAEMEYEQNLTTMQINTALENIERMEAFHLQTAIYRHDLRHHIGLINSCLNCMEYDKIRTYLQGLTKELDDTTLINYCKNTTVNLILSSYARKATEFDIEFEVKADIPEDLAINAKDLCVVLSNALENALQATCNVAPGQERRIVFSCKRKEEKLVLLLQNPYSGTIVYKGDLPQSSRPGHGLGTQSIAAIAKKYRGIFSFEASDGIFYFRLII